MKNLMITARRMLAAYGLLLAVAAPLHAEVLDFNSLTPVGLLGGEAVLDGAYSYTALEGPMSAYLGLHSGAGAILDPFDPGTCYAAACPAGTDSKFYAGLNDGGMKLSRNDGRAFTLAGLDFAFLAPVPMMETLSGQLVLTGTRSTGSSLALSLDFGGQDTYGNFMFTSAALGAFEGVQFSSVTFSACLYLDGACVNSLEQPAFNEAQFALDNINVSVAAVPEPSTWFMLMAGLGIVAWARRRPAAVRAGLAALLLLGATQAAQAHLLTITGDTTGGPTYDRPFEYGQDYYPFRADVPYRVFNVDLQEDANLINFVTTCNFDCGMFVYQDSFDPLNASKNYLGGDDNYVGFATAALGGGLYAGHYLLVITGDSTMEFGSFITTIASTGAFTVSVSAVPEPSAWLMLASGLLLLAFTARRRLAARPMLRLLLASGVLMAGISAPARADIAVIDGDTTWGDTYHRAGRDGGAPPSDYGLDVAYRAFDVTVSYTDWKHQSIVAACDFNCTMFLYRDVFDPANPMTNIMGGSAEGDGRPGLEVWLDVNRTYVLVIAGFYDYDWGKFTAMVGSGGGVSISAIGELKGVSAVPEPAEWGMLLSGLAAVAFIARRRKQA